MSRASTAAIEHVYPLSPLQRGMLFHEVYSEEGSAYQEQVVFRLLGALDPEKMQSAFADAVVRHESLRSAFVWQSEREQVAVVFRAEHVSLETHSLDWSKQASSAQVEQLRTLLAEDHAKGYNLKRPPLARLYLVNLGQDQHYCVFAHHHLILDGWSLATLLRQVLEHYESGLSPAPVASEAWALYRESLARASSNQEALAWRNQIGAAPISTKLPGARVQPDPSKGAQEIRLELTSAQKAAWQAGAKRLRVTPSSLMQAAYALALGRATGSERVGLGVTMSGRPASLPGVEQLVGLLINTLPLAVDLDPAQDSHAFVKKVAQQNLWLQEHQGASLSEVQKWVGQSPMFDTVVVYDNYPIQSLLDASNRVARQGKLEALSLGEQELAALGTQAAQRNHYPLTLVAMPGQDTWWISASFDASRFDPVAISSLLESVAHFGAALVSTPRPLGQVAWPHASSPALSAFAVQELSDLSIAAPEQKDQPALIELHPGGQRTLGWGELARAVARARTRLMSMGLKREERVALALDRGLDWIICLLGIQSAGGCAVLVDPGLALSRKAAMLADSQARWVIASEADDSLDVSPLVARELWASGLDETLPMRPGISRDNLAYIIYTSGSTGMPKGVGVTHGNWLAYAKGFSDALGQAPGLCYAWLSGSAVDLGHTSILGALYQKGTLAVVHPDLAGDPDGLGRALAQVGVDVLKIAPTHLRALMDASGDPGCLLPRRALVCGGEAMSTEFYAQIRALSPELELVNHYGPTETTVGVCMQRRCSQERLGCLGRAMPHAQVTVRDSFGQVLAPGLSGELWLSGASVARGYMGDPRKTALCFVPDPDAPMPGQRAYRSGDRAMRDAQGLWFQGRMDRQLKIRGFRVEPAETEHWLKTQMGVQAALVFPEPGQDAPRGLWAVIVPGASTPELSKLNARAKDELPVALAPLQIRVLDKLPLLASGKIDRQACIELAADESCEKESTVKVQVPQSPELQTLAKIWSGVLKREIQDPKANFFALGGDSILSLQVVARAKKAGLSLLPKDIFDYPTLAALARRLRERASTQGGAQQDKGGTGLALPSEHWLAAQELDDPDHFYQSLILPLAEAPEPSAFSRALDILAKRHSKLAGHREQHEDLMAIKHWSLASAKQNISEHCQRFAQSLGRDGRAGLRFVCFVPASCNLAQDGQPKAWLAGLAHHRCVDAVSWRILLRELSVLMKGEPLSDLPCDADSFAQKLHKKTQAGMFDHELAFWQAQARPGLGLWKGSLNQSFQSCSLLLGRASTQILRTKLPQSHRASIQDALVSAVVGALGKLGQQDCVVELEGHGRSWDDDLDASATVAWCTARYPLLFHAQQDPKATLFGVQQKMHQRPGDGTGYGALLYLSKQGASLQSQQGADLTLNYLGQVDRSDAQALAHLDGLSTSDLPDLGPARCPAWRPQVPLRLTASLRKERLHLRLDADPLRWPAPKLEQLKSVLETELEALSHLIAQDPKVRWHRSDVIGIDEFGAPMTNASLDALIHSLEAGPLGEVADLYPAGQAQVALWLQDQKLQGTQDTAYWNQFVVAWQGVVLAAIAKAFEELARRHATLRTAFVSDAQVALLGVEFEAPRLPIHEITLRQGPHEQEEQAMMQALKSRPLFQTPVADAGALPWELVLAQGAGGRVWLAFRRHHILLDGWSTARLLAEFSALMAGQGTFDAGPRLSSYLQWQARKPQAPARKFWEQMLAQAEPMPAALGHSPGQARQASAHRIACRARISLDLQQSLERLGAAQGLTLNLWCQAAWARVLSLYSGRDRVLFGIVDSGRDPSFSGSDKIVGLLMQTLPMAVSWAPERSLGAFLVELRDLNIELRQHGSRGLDLAQRNLWQSLLVFENYPLQEQLGRHLGKIESVRRIEQTHYALTLSVDALGAGPSGLGLSLRYDDGLYTQAQALGLLETFLDTLRGFSKMDLGAPLDALARLPADPTSMAGPWALSEQGVMAKIMQVAARDPEAIALVEPDGTQLRYAELMRKAQSVGQALRDRGVGPEQAVGICVPRGIAQVIATLGVLAAGAYYVPMDVELVRARQIELCDCAKLVGLVYQGADAPGLSAQEWSLDLMQRVAPGPVAQVHPAQLAYQIFTSGSTGRPKGVGVEHRQLLALIEPLLARLELGAQDTWTLFHRHAFDVSVWEMFGALCSGAKLVVLDAALSRDPARYAACLRDQKVTVANETPSAFYLLQEAIQEQPELCPEHLRHVLFAGEALQPSRLAKAWPRQKMPVFWDLYGNTETTVHATLGRVQSTPHSIGVALPGSRIDLLGPRQTPVPRGAVGEMYIAGSRVSRGYLGEPRLTALSFVPDPHGAPGQRRYKTGDLASRGAAKELYYVGRRDRQVQLRGFRIELSEVESRLARLCPGHRIQVEVQGQGPLAQLLAFVEDPAQRLDAQALFDACGRILPDYQRPARFVLVPRFAMTSNGKLDRDWLFVQAQSSQEQPAPALSEKMRALTELWQALLQRTDLAGIAPSRSFFALGGHSLLAVSMLNQVHARFGLRIALADFLAEPTRAYLKTKLDARAASTPPSAQDLLALLDEVNQEPS